MKVVLYDVAVINEWIVNLSYDFYQMINILFILFLIYLFGTPREIS